VVSSHFRDAKVLLFWFLGILLSFTVIQRIIVFVFLHILKKKKRIMDFLFMIFHFLGELSF